MNDELLYLLVRWENLTGYKPKKSGEWWNGLCPAHSDDKPSLGVTVSKSGNLVFHCFAGCNPDEIKEKLKSNIRVYYNDKKRKKKHFVKRRVKGYYYYHDENKKVLYRKIRYEPKSFMWQSYENFAWVKGLNVEKVLYNLPNVLKSKFVVIVEGEKEADLLKQWGIVATTTGFGAAFKTWEENPSFFEVLKGKTILLLPHNDDVGKEYMEKLGNVLKQKAKVKLIYLPVAPKEDFYDWAQLYNKDDLRKLWLEHDFLE